MATCKRSSLTYTLTLSEAEALVLRDVVSSIAGPESGPRGCMSSISGALADAGVVLYPQAKDTDDRIRFKSTCTHMP